MVDLGQININNVTKTFVNVNGDITRALTNISLDIKPGSFVSFIGPSGCGKSTLLRLIAGLIKPDSGELILDGDEIGDAGYDRGLVFQNPTLFPWLNVYDNIAFGLRARKIYKAIIDTAKDEEYKNEYCCISFVTGDIAENHPEIAEKFTRAIMKASQWVEENKEETAKIQIEKNWVAGDAEFNAQVLSSYSYKPALEGGYEALKITVPDLLAIGLINSNRNADEFIENARLSFDGLSNEDILESSSDTAKTARLFTNTVSAAEKEKNDCCETTTYAIPDCCS